MDSQIIISLIAILAPIGSLFIGAFLQKKRDQFRLQLEALADKKRDNYLEIIMPLLKILINADNQRALELSTKDILSENYRLTIVELELYGSDGVVRSFNNLFQYIYQQNNWKEDPVVILPFLGKILLEVRKELGNKKTRLDEYQMLECLIRDIRKVKSEKDSIYRRISKQLVN